MDLKEQKYTGKSMYNVLRSDGDMDATTGQVLLVSGYDQVLVGITLTVTGGHSDPPSGSTMVLRFSFSLVMPFSRSEFPLTFQRKCLFAFVLRMCDWLFKWLTQELCKG